VFTGQGEDKSGDHGVATLTGGTGKFAGIQGKSTFQCKSVHSAPDFSVCNDQWDYRLP